MMLNYIKLVHIDSGLYLLSRSSTEGYNNLYEKPTRVASKPRNLVLHSLNFAYKIK